MTDGPALIILSLVCANLRNCNRPSSKIRALDVVLALCGHLTDEAKLDRLVPYVIDLLHDDAAAVRSAALRTLMQVVSVSKISGLIGADSCAGDAHLDDHAFELLHFPGIHHSKLMVYVERPRCFCQVHVCTVHQCSR